MNADAWNAQYLVGTPVAAYPGTRNDFPLITRTCGKAWTLGHNVPVVMVDGYAGGIALTHVDVITRADIRAKRPVTDRQLTRANFGRITNTLDRAGVYIKGYWEHVDGRLTVTGLRIGSGPDRIVAKFGDTIVCHADGTCTVRPAGKGGEDR